MNDLRKATASLLAVSDSDETTLGLPVVVDIVVSNGDVIEGDNENTNNKVDDTTTDKEDTTLEEEDTTLEKEIEKISQLLFEFAFRNGYKGDVDTFAKDFVDALNCEHLIFEDEVEGS